EHVRNLARDQPGEFLTAFTQRLKKFSGGSDPSDSSSVSMEYLARGVGPFRFKFEVHHEVAPDLHVNVHTTELNRARQTEVSRVGLRSIPHGCALAFEVQLQGFYQPPAGIVQSVDVAHDHSKHVAQAADLTQIGLSWRLLQGMKLLVPGFVLC